MIANMFQTFLLQYAIILVVIFVAELAVAVGAFVYRSKVSLWMLLLIIFTFLFAVVK